ncbi:MULTISPECIES: PucR family transcriptional regulator [Streptacidiphilus]|uniref:PucR family transcriptional regulator n=1 Tax=Streptacidiphilus cavernicola TaxID=3342716 RepID=A0ABV6UR41_9ACTN|nr:PucR family transcriptional regulator [Streptacidiphilus jeojiense]
MIVGDLLRLEDLDLGLAWGTDELLERRVTGVTSTDLQDPARYLRPGELVLTGLVWWRPDARPGAELRFTTALRSAGVAALLAGEGIHGEVPPALVDACRTHGIPLLAVPSGTSFRAVTDRVYLRLWGGLQAEAEQPGALPGDVRRELAALLETGAPLAEVLARAVALVGLPPCAVVSGSGRVVAAVAGADLGAASVPIGAEGASPFDGWQLTGGSGPMLRDLAELLAPLAASARAEAAARRTAAARLFDTLGGDGGGGTGSSGGGAARPAEALAACGLPAGAPLTLVTARIDHAPTVWAVDALAEALLWLGVPFTAGTDDSGDATALTTGPLAGLPEQLARLQSRLPDRQTLRMALCAAPEPGGAGAPAVSWEAGLRTARVRARHALAGAAPFADADALDSLPGLLAGLPPEVTAAFHDRLLAPLLDQDARTTVSLLDTLAVFLEHDASWARTARRLHIHVNTVHYRVRRIEQLTGRDLSDFADQTDLRAALLCAPQPVGGLGWRHD